MNNERPQVLLIEDNPADADLVEEAIAEAKLDCGFSVMRDGLQALHFIAQLDSDLGRLCPDLVLLDLNLPKVSGEEVLNRLRLSPRGKAVTVLVISSSDAPSDRERSLKLGAIEYFRKPSDLERFMELGPRIRALLESRT